MKTHHIRERLSSGLFGALLVIGTSSLAGDVSIPNTFAPNTPISASQMNQNFQALEIAVDDNAAQLARLGGAGTTGFKEIPVNCDANPNALQEAVANITKGTGGFDLRVTGTCGETDFGGLDDVFIFGEGTGGATISSTAEFATVEVFESQNVGFININVENNGGGLAVAVETARGVFFQGGSFTSNGGSAIEISDAQTIFVEGATVNAGSGGDAVRIVSSQAIEFSSGGSVTTSGSRVFSIFESQAVEVSSASLNPQTLGSFESIAVGASQVRFDDVAVTDLGGDTGTTLGIFNGSQVEGCGLTLPNANSASALKKKLKRKPKGFASGSAISIGGGRMQLTSFCGLPSDIGFVDVGNASQFDVCCDAQIDLEGLDLFHGSANLSGTVISASTFLNVSNQSSLQASFVSFPGDVGLFNGAQITLGQSPIQGSLTVGNGSSADIFSGSTIGNDLFVNGSSSASLFQVTVGNSVNVEDASAVILDNSQVSNSLFVNGTSTANLNNGSSVAFGADVFRGSRLLLRDGSSLGGQLQGSFNSVLEIRSGSVIGGDVFLSAVSSADVSTDGVSTPEFRGSGVFVDANSSFHHEGPLATGTTASFNCNTNGLIFINGDLVCVGDAFPTTAAQ